MPEYENPDYYQYRYRSNSPLEILMDQGGPGYNPFSSSLNPLEAIRNAMSTAIAYKESEKTRKQKEIAEKMQEEISRAQLDKLKAEAEFARGRLKAPPRAGKQPAQAPPITGWGSMFQYGNKVFGVNQDQYLHMTPEQQNSYLTQLVQVWKDYQATAGQYEGKGKGKLESAAVTKAKRANAAIKQFNYNVKNQGDDIDLAAVGANRSFINQMQERWGDNWSEMPDSELIELEKRAFNPGAVFGKETAEETPENKKRMYWDNEDETIYKGLIEQKKFKEAEGYRQWRKKKIDEFRSRMGIENPIGGLTLNKPELGIPR
jgi:hypothetical protein